MSDLHKGPIAWMAKNSVAANLMMIILIFGGLYLSTKVTQEVFPEYEIGLVSISVPYPGASPAEVEQGIVLAVEEQVRGIDGIKAVTGIASEGNASISVELETSADSGKALQDVKNAVDRIISFPQEAERPIVNLVTNRREVISLVLYGDLDEYILRGLAERVRERILQEDGITNVDLAGVRPLEISIEVPQENLRAHDLTLEDVAGVVRRTAIELPAGGVKTDAGEILLRTAERRNYGQEYQNITVVTQPDGTRVRLGEIADIVDGFRDTDESAYFNGHPAVRLRISRVGDQKPTEIAETIKVITQDLADELPQTVGVATWVDASEVYADRVDLLVRNAALGLFLVLIIMGLFLEVRLAFWVMLGIPISVCGSFLLFPAFAVSINMISLFAFIITLGIVVDDAVVVGENIYEMRQKGHNYLDAAIMGAKQIAVPVTFSIATNIVAFAPMLFVPGYSGKLFKVIPIIVISVFLISLFESLFILPAHLAHQKPGKKTGYLAALRRGQARFGQGLKKFIVRSYQPSVKWAIHNRYTTLAIGIVILMLCGGAIAAGFIRFSFMPKLEDDEVVANIALTFGSPVDDTIVVTQRLVDAAKEVMAENGGEDMSRGILTTIGNRPSGGRGPNVAGPSLGGGHIGAVSVLLKPSDVRPLSAGQFAEIWREKVGDLTGLESLTFDYSTGPGGTDIDIELSHSDVHTLELAASDLAEGLQSYAGVLDIDDGYSAGKPQFDFKIKDEARALGLTAGDLGRQLRDAFFGNRAFRQQRGRDEVWTMVRLPEAERTSENDIGQLLIRTRTGGELPLAEAAHIERNRAYTQIKRRDGRRVLNITADLDRTIANANQVLADVSETLIPELQSKYPGLVYSLEGESRAQRESLGSLASGFLIAMMVVFALLAIPFKSYIQPVIVMTAIPFGFVGAVIGHVLLGFELSIISLMGIVALAGVVVNDSLVLIHTANRLREEGANAIDAVIAAGSRRFRPILLTSLTTFFGLAPMMLETSVQARFLIPMAISLGFGILFSTFIILLLAPALYVMVEDFKSMLGAIARLYQSEPEEGEMLTSR